MLNHSNLSSGYSDFSSPSNHQYYNANRSVYEALSDRNSVDPAKGNSGYNQMQPSSSNGGNQPDNDKLAQLKAAQQLLLKAAEQSDPYSSTTTPYSSTTTPSNTGNSITSYPSTPYSSPDMNCPTLVKNIGNVYNIIKLSLIHI